MNNYNTKIQINFNRVKRINTMKNFNNNDIQKYQKIVKNTFGKFNRFGSFTKKLPRIKYSHILIGICTASICYLGYKIYDYKKYRKQHYIDLIQWKSNLANKIKRDDIWQKIKTLSLYNNKQQATKIYQNTLKQQFKKFIIQIQSKRSYQEMYEDLPISKNSKKVEEKQSKKHTKQLILAKNYKSKLDLGYFFKLHTKQYVSSISNNGEYIKKTYTIPLMLFNIPFFVKKKQEVKKIGKKGKPSKIIGHKGKFQLCLECEKINYWNILFLKQKIKDKQDGSLSKINLQEQNSNQNTIEQKQKQQQQVIQASTQRKQLLFQCRKRIKEVEQQLKQNLKSVIDENWQKKSSTKQFANDNTFTISRWEDNEQANN